MIAVTGASGFVGRYAVAELVAAGLPVRACIRRPAESGALRGAEEVVESGDVLVQPNWHACVEGAEVILHIAGSAHSKPQGDAAKEAAVRRVNVDATASLARAALEAAVRRFVFVSSIGVNGSYTQEVPFVESTSPAPADFYSRTKLEAEQRLQRLCAGSAMELVIVRPTLVAGAGAPGNLERLARLIARGMLIPDFGTNRRALVGVRSLALLLRLACTHPGAARKVFLAADDPPLSTRQIAETVALGMGKRARIVTLSPKVLRPIASMFGRTRDLTRLSESLLVDSRAAREELAWITPVPIEEELRALGAAVRRGLAGF